MKPVEKIRVAVLYGGRSAEHEISLKSAANVIEYLDKDRFEIIPIGIDKKGNWFLGQDIFMHSLEHKSVAQLSKNSTWFTPEWVGRPMEKQTLPAVIAQKMNEKVFDVVFPVVHGPLCEDGTLQGLLELADVPYVGSGVLSSSIGMDKDVSKRLARLAGINTPPYLVFKQDKWLENPEKLLELIIDKIAYPLFVKPANTGSSIGVTKVKKFEELADAINLAFKFDTKILIEKGLNIQELEVAVLEALEPGAEPIVSLVGEIKTNHEFYSYDAKYLDENGAQLLIPANVSTEIQLQARLIAKELFLLLECEGMARVDLFYHLDSKQIYFNEINTLPGFTQISMYPKLMNASGISYPDLLTHLIQLALKRHEKRSQLARSYAL